MGRLIITVIIIFTSFGLKASSADSLFEAANKAYSAGDYNAAQNMYQKLIDNGFKSPELFYNMGNACFKQNNLAKSILFYERAKRIEPYDDEINFNLQLARTYTIDKIDEIPPFFLKRWIQSAALFITYETSSLISITCFILFVLFVLIYIFTSNYKFKKSGFILSVILLVFSISFILLAGKRYKMQTTENEAIITSSNVTVKGSPDISGTELFVIHEGTKVILEDELSGWYEVRLSDGNKGWITAENLEVI